MSSNALKLALESWFNIANYDDFRGLSDEQVKKQLDFRFGLLSEVENIEALYELGVNQLHDNCFESPDYYYWRSIVQGTPLIDFEKEYRTTEEIKFDEESHDLLLYVQRQAELDREEYLTDRPEEKLFWEQFDKIPGSFNHILKGNSVVKGLHITTLKEIHDELLNINVFGSGQLFDGIDPQYLRSDVNSVITDKNIRLYGRNTESVYLDIDLTGGTDAEILDHIKGLLPIWRKKLNIPSPKKLKVTPTVFKKALTYNLIPLLDLKIWSAMFGLTLTNQYCADLLFNNDPDRGTADYMKLTVKPWFKKVEALLIKEQYTDFY
ncbi:DUF6387 family protein [Alteromonas macleodii]|uniref:DUF6387 family protein n=1 Tax=Alteromonas macleodii TaxID=28108 RepID=UPI001926AB8F|nr:DUF6387 family protein [Alteromonas macleodii]MBL3809570.1 hypothetical protein [Alteromonas macleodii]MBL3883107.1 hypothetical protein [Alteromonas macleodii]